MSISAATVKELRERTGLGMMECKKALVENHGNIEEAISWLRKNGQAKADNKSGRTAAEGAIAIARSQDGLSAVMLEVNCETDFVARDSNFLEFSEKAVQTAMKAGIKEVEKLLEVPFLGTHQTVDEARKELVTKIGENIQLRRLEILSAETVTGAYLHGTRIGVVVGLKNGDEALARDIAMHIAASRPTVIHPHEVSKEAIESEREIFSAQARESGKPQEIIDKMVDGRIQKFLAEVSLLGQPFVKDPNITIAQLLKSKNAEVTGFQRLEVGEGIQKKEVDFVKEVMEQVRS